ncbi:TraB/VirB10 family protein [Rubrivivax gelatinosus]|uniref:TraB/VirB10 family protein n=1 Tax=Rubrivivax gelatinosus TaxID=28068 RepID=UPI0002D2A411|nr:TraB/VirB10 family protein [Rubrivivax gelatinosus]MBG6083009.1 conjugal transfer pilus assembly protein TraB [Rubrivivax gelatinosus]
MAKSLKEFWRDSSKNQRLTVMGVGFVGSMIAIAAILDSGNPSAGPQRKPSEISRAQLALPKVADKSVEGLAAAQQAQSDELTRLRDEIARERQDKELLLGRLNESDRNGKQPDSVTTDLLNEVVALKKEVSSLQAKQFSAATGSTAPSLNDPLPTPAASEAAASAPEAQRGRRLQVSGEAKPVAKKSTEQGTARPAAYLPPGTMMEATLLNGIDAPTNSVAQKNPVPSVMRVKTDAVLPNYHVYDVKECFVLVSGFGVLSTSRANLRTENISCIREDGRVLEGRLEGYVVGEDGSVGLRGPLVSKQGQLVAQALAAGVLSGWGEALRPSTIPQLSLSTSSTQLTERATPQTVLESGVARGFSDASKSAGAFYMEMARESTPFVEITAGRKATLVLIRGLELR